MDIADAVQAAIDTIHEAMNGGGPTDINNEIGVENYGAEIMQPLADADLVPSPRMLTMMPPQALAHALMQAVGAGVLIGRNLTEEAPSELPPLSESLIADFAMDLAMLPTSPDHDD